ncbi:MAG: hypothetical protein M3014_12080 [Chloroflexota bacterium]|nr:hypothetical protein [Chloroflexota bacterium]
MAQQSSKKRHKGAGEMKIFIAAASVTATIAGWAMLPANDPHQASAATNSPPYPIATPLVPQDGQDPNTDNSQQYQLPTDNSQQYPSDYPAPFTRSHSSR